MISEPSLPRNYNDCSVEQINNCASVKRNAFKAKRANAVTTIDVHQLQFVGIQKMSGAKFSIMISGFGIFAH